MHSQLETPRIIIFVHFIMAGDLGRAKRKSAASASTLYNKIDIWKIERERKTETENQRERARASVLNVPWLNDLVDGSLLQQLQTFNFPFE